MEIKKLILTMSFPIMISMLVQALYNIVDSMFIARVSEDALAAVSLCYPVQMVMVCCRLRNRGRHQRIAVKISGREETGESKPCSHARTVLRIMQLDRICLDRHLFLQIISAAVFR